MMSWFNTYKPQTSGTEVARVMRENGNAFTALGKAFDDIGENVIKKKKADEQSALNKLRTDSMKFAFEQAKEKDAQNKADEVYLTQVYNRPNKKSFEANFDGTIKPSVSAQGKARAYWDEQNKKLELASALVDDEFDEDFKKDWNNFRTVNPKGTYNEFAKAYPDVVEDASVEAINSARNAWDKGVKSDALFDMEKKKVNANLANSASSNKLNKYKLQQLKDNDKKNEDKNTFERELLLTKDKEQFIIDKAKQGKYIPREYLVKNEDKGYTYSATTGKNIVSLVSKALGLDNSLASFDDKVQQQFNNTVTGVDAIARKYNVPANQAYTMYLATTSNKEKNTSLPGPKKRPFTIPCQSPK